MKNQKGFIGLPVLIAIILGIVILGGGAYLVTHQNATPKISLAPDQTNTAENTQTTTNANVQDQATPQTSPSETAGWKTYTNTRYGFEFKYPKEYPPGIYDPKARIDVLVDSNAETLRITTNNSLSTDAFADFLSIWPFTHGSNGNLEELTSDNILKIIKLNMSIYTSDPYKVELTKITFAGKEAVELQGHDDSISLYKLIIVPIDSYHAIAIQQNKKSEIYNAIISTFKFTK